MDKYSPDGILNPERASWEEPIEYVYRLDGDQLTVTVGFPNLAEHGDHGWSRYGEWGTWQCGGCGDLHHYRTLTGASELDGQDPASAARVAAEDLATRLLAESHERDRSAAIRALTHAAAVILADSEVSYLHVVTWDDEHPERGGIENYDGTLVANYDAGGTGMEAITLTDIDITGKDAALIGEWCIRN